MQDSTNNSPYQTTQNISSTPGVSTSPSVAAQPSLDMGVQPSKFSKFNLKQNKFKLKVVLPIILLFLVVGAVLAGMTLVQTSQDVRQQASGGGPDYSCGTGDGLFSDFRVNSSPCLWGGAPYYKCDAGYHNENNGCRANGANPSNRPTAEPSNRPTAQPSTRPTIRPSALPSVSSNPSSTMLPSPVSSVPPTMQPAAEGMGYYPNGESCVLDPNNPDCADLDGLRFCFPASNCSQGSIKATCGANEYSTYASCNGAQIESYFQTYRISGSLPYGEFCEPCTDANLCDLSQTECEAQVAQDYGKVFCFHVGSCYFGALQNSCDAYTSNAACLQAEQALNDQPICWTSESNCLSGLSQSSCGSGTYASKPECFASLSNIENTTSLSSSGSLSGATLIGE